MLNFLVLGDWGRKGTPDQRTVAQGMAQVAARLGSRFVVTTGDNFYDDGVESLQDAHWQESFEHVYTAAALQVPWYIVLGNHDYRSSIDSQINYSQVSPRWCLPARYHARQEVIGGTETVLLVFLDTSPFITRYQLEGAEYTRGISEQDTRAQLDWLHTTLATSTARWKLIFGHHPIYSASPFHGDTPELQQRLLPLLHTYNAQAYICGHEHDLQHLSVDGIEYVVSGAGAERREAGWRDFSRFSTSTLGFCAVSLTRHALGITFYDAQGQQLYTVHQPLDTSPRTPALSLM